MNQRGFTLMELAFSVTIIAVLSLVSASAISIASDGFSRMISRASMERQSQNTFRILQNTIVNTAQDSIIRFQNRRFEFKTMDGHHVEFRCASGSAPLRYRFIGEHDWKTVLSDIVRNSFSFSYQQYDGTRATRSEDIRQVVIQSGLSVAGENAQFRYTFYVRN